MIEHTLVNVQRDISFTPFNVRDIYIFFCCLEGYSLLIDVEVKLVIFLCAAVSKAPLSSFSMAPYELVFLLFPASYLLNYFSTVLEEKVEGPCPLTFSVCFEEEVKRGFAELRKD